jgi:5-methyltetrahydropteroyltriglutamate--homocysteine methyltransferase
MTLIPTTVVGSYPQPDWLVDRALLSKGVPRVNLHELWRIAPEHLAAAQDDATRLAIRDMERAGIDIITDGECRRESYSNYFVAALDGVDLDHPAIITNTVGRKTEVPRVFGPIRRRAAVTVRDLQFLRANVGMADRKIKITLPGPFTMAQQAAGDYYKDKEEMAMAFAEAVNAEALDLQAAGADVIQIDEPWLRNDPQAARRFAVKAINRALQGVTTTTVVHLCFGYAAVVPGQKPTGYAFLTELADSTAQQISIECAQPALELGMLKDLSNKTILLGVIDLGSPRIESAQEIAGRIRNGLKHIDAERLIAAPDCGMKYLPREVAFGKLKAMAEGAAIVRAELEGS